MKEIIREQFKSFLKDRPMVVLSVAVVLVAVAYIIYVAFSLSSSDLLIATHYTAFGKLQYYRTRWYYLFTFIALALVIVVAHLSLMVKLRGRELRSLGIGLGWLTIIIFLILFFITHSVLGIAYFK